MNDLEHKTESELQELLDNTARILNGKRETKRHEAIEQIQSIASAAGITLTIKGERKKRGEQSETTQKNYQHPDKPNLTWNGSGPTPKWLKTLVASTGKALAEFEVEVAQTEG